MIIRRYSDGSEGYEYEINDRVIVQRTIHGGWFDYGPTHSNECVVREVRGKPLVQRLGIQYSPEWGLASCFPWMVWPEIETYKNAKILEYPQ